MGTISYTIPTAGSTLNSIADPEVATALQTLLTWANGNIDTTNLSAAALAALGTFSQGTLAARPAAGTAGRVYYGTDTALWYQDNGTAWGTVLVAGAWTALTLGTNIGAAAGFFTPSARLEGDVVRLKGSIQNNTGGSIGIAYVAATVPAGMRPASSVYNGGANDVSSANGAPFAAWIQASGSLGVGNVSVALTNGQVCSLDGITYTLT